MMTRSMLLRGSVEQSEYDRSYSSCLDALV